MTEPINVVMPYPDIKLVKEDIKTALILSPSYAGIHGELNGVLSYIYHYFNFRKLGKEDVAKRIMGLAMGELKHLEILGQVIYNLGTDPVFTEYPRYRWNYYSTAGISYSTIPEKMIMDDISGELIAIKEYEKILGKINNQQVSAIIKRIILDEELHVKVLEKLLKEMSA